MRLRGRGTAVVQTDHMKNKTNKKTKRAAPINPWLQRILDLLDAAYERLDSDGHDRTFDKIVEGVLAGIHGGTADLDGAKRTILALAAKASDRDLDECLAVAEEFHRETCVCCRSNTRAA